MSAFSFASLSIFCITFIGHSPVFACFACFERASPARRNCFSGSIRGADFDRIAAKLRQWWNFTGARGCPLPRGKSGFYQLFLKPAEMLLLVVPCAVSPTEPEIETPPNSFCSAPSLRSHLSSEVEGLCPADTLVSVSVTSSLGDCSVGVVRSDRGDRQSTGAWTG